MPCCGHCDMLCSDIAIKVLLKVVSAFLFCIKTMQQRNLSAILNIDDFFSYRATFFTKKPIQHCARGCVNCVVNMLISRKMSQLGTRFAH